MLQYSEKFKPQLLTDIIGNKPQIAQIKNWILKFNDGKKTVGQSKKRRKIDITFFKDDDELECETTMDDVPDYNVDISINDINDTKENTKTETQHSCLIAIGKHGVGKTCTILNILTNLEFDTHIINVSKKCATKLKSAKISSKESTDKKMNKGLEKLIDNVINGINIVDNLNCEIKKNKVIVIDDLESINTQLEKNFIVALLKKNETYWHLPVIFISNGKHSKLLTIIKYFIYS